MQDPTLSTRRVYLLLRIRDPQRSTAATNSSRTQAMAKKIRVIMSSRSFSSPPSSALQTSSHWTRQPGATGGDGGGGRRLRAETAKTGIADDARAATSERLQASRRKKTRRHFGVEGIMHLPRNSVARWRPTARFLPRRDRPGLLMRALAWPWRVRDLRPPSNGCSRSGQLDRASVSPTC